MGVFCDPLAAVGRGLYQVQYLQVHSGTAESTENVLWQSNIVCVAL
jgi:hypothetical protein